MTNEELKIQINDYFNQFQGGLKNKLANKKFKKSDITLWRAIMKRTSYLKDARLKERIHHILNDLVAYPEPDDKEKIKVWRTDKYIEQYPNNNKDLYQKINFNPKLSTKEKLELYLAKYPDGFKNGPAFQFLKDREPELAQEIIQATLHIFKESEALMKQRSWHVYYDFMERVLYPESGIEVPWNIYIDFEGHTNHYDPKISGTGTLKDQLERYLAGYPKGFYDKSAAYFLEVRHPELWKKIVEKVETFLPKPYLPKQAIWHILNEEYKYPSPDIETNIIVWSKSKYIEQLPAQNHNLYQKLIFKNESLKEKIQKYLNQYSSNKKSLDDAPTHIKTREPELFEEIKKATSFLDGKDNDTPSRRLWHVLNDFYEIPRFYHNGKEMAWRFYRREKIFDVSSYDSSRIIELEVESTTKEKLELFLKFNGGWESRSVCQKIQFYDPDLWFEIEALTSFLDKNSTEKHRCWHVLEEKYEVPKCPITDQEVNWLSNEYLIYKNKSDALEHMWDIRREGKDVRDQKTYYRWVESLTERTYRKHGSLMNESNLERGKGPNKYQVDHIFSKFLGFVNGIHPKIIAHRCNLQMLLASENAQKSYKLNDDSSDAIRLSLAKLTARIEDFENKSKIKDPELIEIIKQFRGEKLDEPTLLASKSLKEQLQIYIDQLPDGFESKREFFLMKDKDKILWAKVVEATNFLDQDSPAKQRCWHILNDIYERIRNPITNQEPAWPTPMYLSLGSNKDKNPNLEKIRTELMAYKELNEGDSNALSKLTNVNPRLWWATVNLTLFLSEDATPGQRNWHVMNRIMKPIANEKTKWTHDGKYIFVSKEIQDEILANNRQDRESNLPAVKQQLEEYFKNNGHERSIAIKNLRSYDSELYTKIIELTSFLNQKVSSAQRIWHIENEILEIPKDPVTDKPANWCARKFKYYKYANSINGIKLMQSKSEIENDENT